MIHESLAQKSVQPSLDGEKLHKLVIENASSLSEFVIALNENNEESLSGGGDRNMVISTPIPRYIVISGAPITP